MTLDLDGGTLGEESGTITKSGRWGQTVSIGIPERHGYSFEGWNTVGGRLPKTFDSAATYKALWSAVKGFTITVQESDINVSKSQSGNIITFTSEECSSYNWTLDDKSIGTAQTCTVNVSELSKGTYTLSLEAQKGGSWYSYYAQIKIE